MKNLSLLFVSALCFSVYAFAQANPSVAPAVAAAVNNMGSVAAPAVTPVVVAPSLGAPVSAGFIGLILAIVACLNIVLSAVQQIFSKLSLSEPGWLQTVSTVILTASKYLGSNPDAPKSNTPSA